MLKCKRCGNIFYGFGSDGAYCPECQTRNSDDFVEIEQCMVCRRYRSKLTNGICGDCIERMSTIETALGLGDVYTESVELNGFIVYVLGKDRIEKLLREALEQRPKRNIEKDAERFCMDDLWIYTDYLSDMEYEKSRSKRFQRKGKKENDTHTLEKNVES